METIPYPPGKFRRHHLTHSFPMHPFATPCKHQKTQPIRFLRCFQGVEKGCIGNEWVYKISFWSWVICFVLFVFVVVVVVVCFLKVKVWWFWACRNGESYKGIPWTVNDSIRSSFVKPNRGKCYGCSSRD